MPARLGSGAGTTGCGEDVCSGAIGADEELTHSLYDEAEDTMGIIAWILIGLLAGAIAKAL
ncbi:GlsB/YeaQ/YmgE family stress response membrane protein, partial [Streptomyces sp. NPDC002784]